MLCSTPCILIYSIHRVQSALSTPFPLFSHSCPAFSRLHSHRAPLCQRPSACTPLPRSQHAPLCMHLAAGDSPPHALTLHPTRACPSPTPTLAHTRSRSRIHTHYLVLCCPHTRHNTILAPQGGHTLPYHSTSHSPTRSRTPPRSPISFRYTSLVAPNTTSQYTHTHSAGGEQSERGGRARARPHAHARTAAAHAPHADATRPYLHRIPIARASCARTYAQRREEHWGTRCTPSPGRDQRLSPQLHYHTHTHNVHGSDHETQQEVATPHSLLLVPAFPCPLCPSSPRSAFTPHEQCRHSTPLAVRRPRAKDYHPW